MATYDQMFLNINPAEGSGKTHLLNGILAQVRAAVSSGIAAAIMVHSCNILKLS